MERDEKRGIRDSNNSGHNNISSGCMATPPNVRNGHLPIVSYTSNKPKNLCVRLDKFPS